MKREDSVMVLQTGGSVAIEVTAMKHTRLQNERITKPARRSTWEFHTKGRLLKTLQSWLQNRAT